MPFGLLAPSNCAIHCNKGVVIITRSTDSGTLSWQKWTVGSEHRVGMPTARLWIECNSDRVPSSIFARAKHVLLTASQSYTFIRQSRSVRAIGTHTHSLSLSRSTIDADSRRPRNHMGFRSETCMPRPSVYCTSFSCALSGIVVREPKTPSSRGVSSLSKSGWLPLALLVCFCLFHLLPFGYRIPLAVSQTPLLPVRLPAVVFFRDPGSSCPLRDRCFSLKRSSSLIRPTFVLLLVAVFMSHNGSPTLHCAAILHLLLLGPHFYLLEPTCPNSA